MNKDKVLKSLRLAIIIIFSMLMGSIVTIVVKNDSVVPRKNIRNTNSSDLDALYETYNTITNEYYKDVDSKKLIDGAIDGMLKSIDDEHTSYFDKKAKEDFDTELAGSYYGIGAQIQLTNEGVVKIVKIFDDSPAQKAGLQVEDEFVSIDGVSTEGMDATDVANILRSDKVKRSKLIIRRDNEEKEIEVKKANVTLFSVSSEMLEEDDKKIGYIGVSIFSQNTYSQFKDALDKLEKENMDSLIIDLRGNTGGYLSTVTNMLELFIDRGNTLYKIQTNNGVNVTKARTPSNKNYKIVILINNESASASEIMSAAMKENNKALLVGQTTYGKGTVQITKDLSNGAMIKYTIEKWLTPSGNNIDKEGIKPDYEIILSDDYYNDPSRANDNQLQKAIELLK